MASTVTDRAATGSGLGIKAPVRVATTANITLSGEQTIDDVAVVDGDRVLVKDQTTGADNGIYVVKTGAWERSGDWDATGDVVTGTLVFVTLGTVQTRRLYHVITTGTIIVGTTSVSMLYGQ